MNKYSMDFTSLIFLIEMAISALLIGGAIDDQTEVLEMLIEEQANSTDWHYFTPEEEQLMEDQMEYNLNQVTNVSK